MKKTLNNHLVALLFLAGSVLPLPAETAYDSRRIVCARPCTLRLQAGIGTIEVKVPTASATLKTLYQPGDSYPLDGGKEYVLRFNESPEGYFSFDLQFTPCQGGSAVSCRVRTVADPPFIQVDREAWTGRAGQVEVNTDRTKPFLVIRP
jgi:hypothetical protein